MKRLKLNNAQAFLFLRLIGALPRLAAQSVVITDDAIYTDSRFLSVYNAVENVSRETLKGV